MGPTARPRRRPGRHHRARLTALAAVLVTGAATVAVPLTAPAASAAVPPVVPSQPTVTADALPTVQVDGVVWAQAVVGNTVYATGQFTSARPAGAPSGTGETPRSDVLAYDITTGALLTSWAPALNGTGLAITASPDGRRVYVAGTFTAVDGAPRSRIVALDAATGAVVTAFAADLNSRVRSLAAVGDTVYAGGAFTAANGQARSRLAAFSAADGSLLPWAPTADAEPYAMTAPAGAGELVVGGRFSTLNGTTALGSGALDLVTGATLPWALSSTVNDYGTGAAIYSLSDDGKTVYGTGYNYYGTGNLENAFAADAAGGALRWVNGCRGDTYSNVPIGGVLYVVGHAHDCSSIGGHPETSPRTFQRTMAFATAGGNTNVSGNFTGRPAAEILPWLPTLTMGTYTGQNQAAWSVAGNGDYVVEGGEFPSVNGRAQQGLVRFAVRSAAPGKEGPQGYPELTPSLVALPQGGVRATVQAAWDRDDRNLTYELLRGATTATSTVVARTTSDSAWWSRPTLGLVDAGAPAGDQTYRVRVSDPWGNAVTGAAGTVTAAATAPSAYRAAVLADGAQDYWRLDEATGTTAYDQAGADDLSLTTSAARAQSGAMQDGDRATAFDGTGTVPGTTAVKRPAPQTFSVEAWFRTTTTTGGKLIGFGSSATGASAGYDRHVYLRPSGQVTFGVHPGSRYRTVTSAAAYDDGRWHQVVATLGSAGMVLYVDGAQVAADATTTSAQVLSGYWRVAGDSLSSTWPGAPTTTALTGTVDEVAVYPTQLSTATVASHRSKGAAPADVAPTAAFTASTSPLAVAVDASGSSDPDGTIASYAWDFGDGARGTGRTASHTYAAPGTYPVTLTVTDDLGATGTSTTTVTVTAPNRAPTAAFTSATSGLGASLDGSASTDPDGTVTSWSWDLGDGARATGATTTHTYAAAGTYPVVLTVTDDAGATATVTHPVTVSAPAAPGVLAADSFARTVTGGLGSADTGGAWTTTGSTASYAVAGGSAQLKVAAGATAAGYLGGVSSTATDARVTASLDRAATGGGTYASLVGRRVGTSSYALKARVDSTGAVTAYLTRTVAGTETTLRSLALAGVSASPGQRLALRLQVAGTAPTALSAKVWPAETAEPATWQLTATDTTDGLQAAGAVGISSYLSGTATNGPAVLSFRDLSARVPSAT